MEEEVDEMDETVQDVGCERGGAGGAVEVETWVRAVAPASRRSLSLSHSANWLPAHASMTHLSQPNQSRKKKSMEKRVTINL
jgi:hypothetical protein